jgi:hypothetical protein
MLKIDKQVDLNIPYWDLLSANYELIIEPKIYIIDEGYKLSLISYENKFVIPNAFSRESWFKNVKWREVFNPKTVKVLFKMELKSSKVL